MGFFFGLMAYLAAVAMIVVSAVAGSVWLTRPLPASTSVNAAKPIPQRSAGVTPSMKTAEISLTSQRKAKHQVDANRRASRQVQAKTRRRYTER